jgi:hypothetical protein
MFVHSLSATGQNWMSELHPQRKIALPSIYFAHDREVIEHEGQLVAVSPFIRIDDTDVILKEGSLQNCR